MKSALKIIALILCVTLLFSSCEKGAGVETTTETTPQGADALAEDALKGDGVLSLPYNEADGLNPFFVKSNENIYICKMLYQSLFSVNENFNRVPQIAQSIVVNGTTATVQLRSDAACRDSQPINAYDVVYSFNLAKESYAWSGDLIGVLEATVNSQFSVNFTLDFEDAYVGAKLCFPIVKQGTADTQNAIPKGCGEYYYSKGKLYSAFNKPTISLSGISTNKSAENAFKIGTTDVFFNDLSNCEYTGIVGKTEEVMLNNMVYLGLNSNNGALNKYVRSAIAAGINCEDIVVSSYQGHGKAVKLPINPNAEYAKSVSTIELTGNAKLATEILDRCGFIRYSGKSKTNGAYSLSFKLIVNSDNKYRLAAAYNIADTLNAIGFAIQVLPLTFEDYNQRILAGNYDMYLGEIKLDGSMDLSQLFRGTLSNGIDQSSSAAVDYFNFRAGKIVPEDYFETFAEEYPFVPILFRSGYVVTSTDINVSLSTNPFDLYNNL